METRIIEHPTGERAILTTIKTKNGYKGILTSKEFFCDFCNELKLGMPSKYSYREDDGTIGTVNVCRGCLKVTK